MKFKNPIHQQIYDQVVSPTLKQERRGVEGRIIGVDYYNQTVDVFWKDQNGYAGRTAKELRTPRGDDGVFSEGLKMGDEVEIGFRNGNIDSPYIVSVYNKKSGKSNYRAKYGSSIPKGIYYM